MAIAKENVVPSLTELLQDFVGLHGLGFRHISTTNNDCVSKYQDYGENRYVNYFEMVFYKPSL
jgi:hypothetical protein